MASKQQRSKTWGRQVENDTKDALRPIWPSLARTGSVNYRKAAPDLVADPRPLTDLAKKIGVEKRRSIPLVVTRDKRQPLLVTLLASDFVELVTDDGPPADGVVIQCKGREKTWIGTLMRELRAAVAADLKGA